MTVTSETVVTTLLDSALLRADLEALLEELRRADDEAYPVVGGTVNMEERRWGRIQERADLLRQSYSLAKARAATQAMQGQGAGR